METTSKITMPVGVTAVMLPELDFDEQVELCVELGLKHYSLRPRVIPADHRGKPYSNWGNHKFDLTPASLVKEASIIRTRLMDAGIEPFATLPNCTTDSSDEEIKLDLEGAAAVGAGRMRLRPEFYPAGPFDYPLFLQKIIDRYHALVELARPYNVKFVIETHCGTLAASPCLAWNILRHFSPQQMGAIFDLPNYVREGLLRANLAVAVLGPYIDHVHVGGSRRVVGEYDSQGFRVSADQMCPLGESDLNIPIWLNALAQAKVNVPLVIEDFTPNVPAALRLKDAVHALRKIVAI